MDLLDRLPLPSESVLGFSFCDFAGAGGNPRSSCRWRPWLSLLCLDLYWTATELPLECDDELASSITVFIHLFTFSAV